MDDTTQSRVRRFHVTPGSFVTSLLAVEVLLWLSERFVWPAWHKGYAVLTAVASVGVAMLVMLASFAVSLFFRRRFQFSIRSLLVMVVVVALACSWLTVEMERARQQKEAVDRVVNLRGTVEYDWQVDADGTLLDPHLLATWVKKTDGYSRPDAMPRPHRAGHPAQQGRGGEGDWLVAVLPANNLIHLPDKLVGVFDSLGFAS